MKRWFIARMGKYDPDDPNANMPKVAQYTPNWRAWSVGSKPWCFGQLAIADLTAISADAEIKILPDATLDAAWSTIPTSVRNRVKNEMEGAGFVWSVQNTWTVRQILVYILQQIQPALTSVEVGDVTDIEQ